MSSCQTASDGWPHEHGRPGWAVLPVHLSITTHDLFHSPNARSLQDYGYSFARHASYPVSPEIARNSIIVGHNSPVRAMVSLEPFEVVNLVPLVLGRMSPGRRLWAGCQHLSRARSWVGSGIHSIAE
jgi:hypothetical protein